MSAQYAGSVEYTHTVSGDSVLDVLRELTVVSLLVLSFECSHVIGYVLGEYVLPMYVGVE